MSEPRQRRFCLVTTGRTGSTALMDVLATGDEVAVPSRQLDCEDHELLHPQRARAYAAEYTRLSGRPVRDEPSLVEAFFRLNAGARWAGFKTMPNRHRDIDAFLARPDLRIIVLLREDVVATAASFLLARTRGTWRRAGGTPDERVVFAPGHARPLAQNLLYLHQSTRRLCAVPGAIHLRYERLCERDFAEPRLDEFFERPIRLADPRPPVRPEVYVQNFEAFRDFVESAWRRLERQATP